LRALARALQAPDSAILLADRATEASVRARDLSRARVVAFATHGLVSGELGGLREPALVLTPPPADRGDNDDGLLTASEIARSLTLDAEMVILSACNTAAGDGRENAEGLSGLAKAFFYAGTRSLLVSHWSVVSAAAVRLTTAAFQELAAHPDIGRSEALRRSMLALLEDRSDPLLAHPMMWGPFAVAGEGGLGAPPEGMEVPEERE
jgi:CHAT domain-containing protein